MPKTDLLQGILDLLILQILALGPNHGWVITQQGHRQLATEPESREQFAASMRRVLRTT